MLDTIAKKQLEGGSMGAQEHCRLSTQKRKLGFLLAQSGDPDSTEFLEKLDRIADVLSRKSKSF